MSGPGDDEKNSLFGDDEKGSLFGDSPDSGSLFGDSPDSGSLFGDSPDSGSLFGDSPDSGSLFGDSPDSGSLFGDAPPAAEPTATDPPPPPSAVDAAPPPASAPGPSPSAAPSLAPPAPAPAAPKPPPPFEPPEIADALALGSGQFAFNAGSGTLWLAADIPPSAIAELRDEASGALLVGTFRVEDGAPVFDLGLASLQANLAAWDELDNASIVGLKPSGGADLEALVRADPGLSALLVAVESARSALSAASSASAGPLAEAERLLLAVDSAWDAALGSPDRAHAAPIRAALQAWASPAGAARDAALAVGSAEAALREAVGALQTGLGNAGGAIAEAWDSARSSGDLPSFVQLPPGSATVSLGGGEGTAAWLDALDAGMKQFKLNAKSKAVDDFAPRTPAGLDGLALPGLDYDKLQAALDKTLDAAAQVKQYLGWSDRMPPHQVEQVKVNHGDMATLLRATRDALTGRRG
jgi:hypothetical protein